jgi:hypothetical protein
MAARPRRGRRNRSAYTTYDRPGARALYGAGRLATEPAVDSGGLLLYFIMLYFISLAPHCASSHSRLTASSGACRPLRGMLRGHLGGKRQHRCGGRPWAPP